MEIQRVFFFFNNVQITDYIQEQEVQIRLCQKTSGKCSLNR